MARKASVRDVRRVNRALVVRHLMFAGQTSRSAIGDATGLSAGTVTNLISDLIDEGTVQETGVDASQEGRPRVLLSIDRTAGAVIGADVSEQQITTALFDLTLGRIDVRVKPFPSRRISPTEVSDVLVEHVHELLSQAGIPRERVIGLGLGVPGLVEHPTRPEAVVHAELIGWAAASLSDLERRLGFPVLVDNGAKTTTQAEAWFGAARGVDHAAVVFIGDGVGAGIITNGRLYRGASSGAGEWGHTKITLDGTRCLCGSYGCVITVVGATAVLDRWRGRDHEFAGHEPEGITALLADYTKGEAAAVSTVGKLVEHLGLALSNLVNLYNPQKIVVSGWFGDVIAEHLLEELRASVRHFSLKQPGEEVVVERSSLGTDAVALGAATLPIDRFIETGWPQLTHDPQVR